MRGAHSHAALVMASETVCGVLANFSISGFLRPMWPIESNADQKWLFTSFVRKARGPQVGSRNKLVKSL